MTDECLMQGSPPPATQQVTLSNWRMPPFNRWSFHHVQQLVPCAIIARDESTTSPLPVHGKTLPAVDFINHCGEQKSLEQFMQDSQTDAFLVMRRGQIVFEKYFNGMTPRTTHIAMSVSKSLTAALVGVFVGKGWLNPADTVIQLIPELAGSAFADCTLQHLLDMTAGVDFNEDYLADAGLIVEYREVSGWKPRSTTTPPHDLRSWLSLRKKSGVHGERFHYVSPCTDLLGWVLERSGGKPFHELFAEFVWGPMGAQYDAFVTVDSLGAPRTAGGICLTLRDLARFGQLFLQHGVIDGEQIIPQAWVADTVHNFERESWRNGESYAMLPNGGYRNKWWITGNELGAYTGIGVYGQWIYVAPKTETVIAVFSSQPLPVDDKITTDSLACFEAIASLQ